MGQVATTKRCALCGTESQLVIEHLGVCARCVCTPPGAEPTSSPAYPLVQRAHTEARRAFALPAEPPRTPGGVACPLCSQSCIIGPGERGYCGLRTYQAVDASGRRRLGHLAGTPARGVLHWYRDLLPTNCVADWVCAGSRQRGAHNLAVFYASCTLDCLYCQNGHFREVDPVTSAEFDESLVDAQARALGADASELWEHARAAALQEARRA